MKIPIPSYETTVVVILLAIVALAIISFPGQLHQAELQAVRQLGDAGYKDPTVTGVRILGCSEDDLYRIGFKAIGANDKPVSGVVCSAPFKGATIRLD